MKYVVAGLLMLGLSVPAMAQNANYNEMLKPIAQSLKATPNMDAKTLKNLIKDYQKDFKKDPKALVALGETLLMNKQYDEATNIANNVISKYKDCGNAYILLGDIAAFPPSSFIAAISPKRIYALPQSLYLEITLLAILVASSYCLFINSVSPKVTSAFGSFLKSFW